jgi:poly(3-hydroxybutyrate) depolymerase
MVDRFKPMRRRGLGVVSALALAAAAAIPVSAQEAGGGLQLSHGMVNVDGRDRPYAFYVSTKAKPDAFNYVVFALPDNGQTAEDFARQSGWARLAEEQGFAVIFPEAVDKTWSPKSGGEDAYIDALWDYAQARLAPPGGLQRAGGPPPGAGGRRGPPGGGEGGPPGGGRGPGGAGPGPARAGAGEGEGGAPRRGPMGVPHWFPFEYMTGSGAGGRIAQEFAVGHPGRVAAVATLNGVPYRGTYRQGDERAQDYLQYMRPDKAVPPVYKALKKDVPVSLWMFNAGTASADQTSAANYWKRVDRVAVAASDRTIDGFKTAIWSDPSNHAQQVRITSVPGSTSYDPAMTSAIWNDFFVHLARWTSSPNGDLGAAMTEAEVDKAFDAKTLTIDGVTYRYYVKVPSSWRPGKSLPVVMSLHGANYPAWQYLSQIKMHEVGEKEGFITVYLNADHQRWDFTAPETRDVKFIGQVREAVLKTYGGDPGRVYLQGFSFGSGMTQMIGLTHPQWFAAISPNDGIGDYSPEVTTWIAELKRKQDIRMPTIVVYGDVDTVASPDALIPARNAMQHAIDNQRAYNHLAEKDRIEKYDSPFTAPYDILVPGGKLVQTGVDARYPKGRFKTWEYTSADPKPLNLFDLVWVTDMSHGGDPREAQLEWDYFKHWRRNPDASLSYIATAPPRAGKTSKTNKH